MKKFITESSNIERDSYLWNMAGGLLLAFQSVIMLIIITHTLDLQTAGIFTIAYANANLYLTIGKYGMRNFQVSDVRHQFDFSDYKHSRIATTAVMIIVSTVYVVSAGRYHSYSFEKSMIIVWMCLFKVIDSVEDVFHGLYHQKGRLDVAAKAMTVRMIITIVVFGAGVVLLDDLLIPLIIATFVTLLVFCIFTAWSGFLWKNERKRTEQGSIKRVGLLLKLCFPLFAGGFLSFYIGNAPKYAIDAVLSDEQQACYGFIAMPVFVIQLLSGFVFTPMIHKMSVLWDGKKRAEFIKRFYRQIGMIILITVICLLGAYVAGIPILSWLYNTDLRVYKVDLLILLLGGGFLGLTSFLCTVITIIRFQKCIIWGYALVAAAALGLSNMIVRRYGVFGAAMLYTALMGCLSLVFGAICIWRIYKES